MIDSKYAKEIIQETIQLIQIPSVQSKSEEDAPFGKEIVKALNYALELCKKLGMRTTNLQNTVGYAEYGEGEEEIAILVHLDVVPVNEPEWEYPPFQGVVENDKIYGRGAVDDKGPAVAAIFAVKRLIEDVEAWNKRIRIIFCTDEESGWRDLPIYHTNEKEPDFAFTPDAEFPLIAAEKGILQVEVGVKKTHEWLIDWSGGSKINVVADHSEVELAQSLKDTLNIDDSLPKIIRHFTGKAAHGSLPFKGENAIVKNLSFLAQLEKDLKDENKFFEELYTRFHDVYGKGLDINSEDEESGRLTLNVGKVRTEGDTLFFELDIRYPVTFEKEYYLDKLNGYFDSCTIINYNAPLFLGNKNPYTEILLTSYQEIIENPEAEPIAIGGGTLARGFKNAVAFGPLFPGEEETAHMSNEFITIDSLLKAHEIYHLALKRLLLK